jgi:hypothetical protein
MEIDMEVKIEQSEIKDDSPSNSTDVIIGFVPYKQNYVVDKIYEKYIVFCAIPFVLKDAFYHVSDSTQIMIIQVLVKTIIRIIICDIIFTHIY